LKIIDSRPDSKRRYRIDLTSMMAECESNYARLKKLLPGELGIQSWELGVSYPGGGDARVHFEVTEVFKFTTTLQISLHAVVPHLLNDTKLVVRMYHDARMAEVVQSTSGGQFKGKYAYPNRRMYHSDEKVQLNHYLGECLNQCVRFGHVLTDLVPPGVVCN